MSKQADKTNKPAPPKAAKPKASPVRQHIPIDSHLLQLTREDPARLTPAQRSQLQRTLGNRALARLVGNRSSVDSKRSVPHSPFATRHSPLTIQAKLTVNAVGDKYEQEADAVAKEVVQKLNAPQSDAASSAPTASPHAQRQTEEEEPIAQRIQRQAALEEEEMQLQRQELPEEEEMQLQRQETEEEELQLQRQELEEEEPQEMARLQREIALEEDEMQLQRQELPEEEEIQLQRQEIEEEDPAQMAMTQRQPQDFTQGGPVDSHIEAQINQSRGGGRRMEDSIRQPMEQAFGADFSDVRIHTDAQAHNLNESIQARAFTTSQDIYFQKGEFGRESAQGQELLAHELAHVIQQNNEVAELSKIQRQQTETFYLESLIKRYINGDILENDIFEGQLKTEIEKELKALGSMQMNTNLRRYLWRKVKNDHPDRSSKQTWVLRAIYWHLSPKSVQKEYMFNREMEKFKSKASNQLSKKERQNTVKQIAVSTRQYIESLKASFESYINHSDESEKIEVLGKAAALIAQVEFKLGKAYYLTEKWEESGKNKGVFPTHYLKSTINKAQAWCTSFATYPWDQLTSKDLSVASGGKIARRVKGWKNRKSIGPKNSAEAIRKASSNENEDQYNLWKQLVEGNVKIKDVLTNPQNQPKEGDILITTRKAIEERKENGKVVKEIHTPEDNSFNKYQGASHTGIVIKVDGVIITTLEGNKGDKAQEINYDLSKKSDQKKIIAFYRPDIETLKGGDTENKKQISLPTGEELLLKVNNIHNQIEGLNSLLTNNLKEVAE